MDLDTLFRGLQMVLGIGLVIFVHELGHFLAARLCKVRVDVFSLGFGPKLLGFRRGDTLYQLAVLPIGGYVRMAGEDRESDDAPARDDELRAKSVGARFFIYSGGVLMNMAFAVVALPLVLFSGVAFNEPVIGSVQPGSGAWQAGLVPGTRVLEVNGHKIASFEYIAQEVALSAPDAVEMVVLPRGSASPRTVRVEPRYEDRLGLSTVGIAPSAALDGAIVVRPDSPASRAGLVETDRIVGIDGPLPELTLDEQLAFASRRGEPLKLRVADASGAEREVVLEPDWDEVPETRLLGLLPALDIVSDLRANDDLEALGLARGDRLVRVNGQRVLRDRDLELALLSGAGPARFEIERGGERRELLGPELDRARALRLAADIALASNTGQCVVVVSPRAPVTGVLADGDRLLAANGVPLASWEDDFLPIVRSASAEQRSLQLRIARDASDGGVAELEVTVTAGAQVLADYGLGRREALYTYRAESFAEAVRVGTQAAWKFLTDSWLMLKRMVLGQVSSKHMGGIISIGMYAYTWAELGISKLVFFLCLLSVNLAFINVLPVPLLDGGHLLFLVIEKLKGSPVSERVFGYSQMVGLVLILSLLVYVTYNDVMRVVSL